MDEALKQVASGVQSDSAIELVTPRRPRPIRKTAQKQPIEEAAGDAESPVEEQLPAIKEEFAKEREEAGSDQSDDRSELSSSKDLIQTEVGELPSDFWRLLGEEAPKPEPPKLDAQRGQASVQRKEADSGTAVATADRPPLQEALTAEWGETVQRVDRIPDRGRAQEVSESRDSETESDIDIDKLARLVYRAIKRKLMIESERSRGRF